MPPKRKSTGAAATRSTQSTLSFNAKKGDLGASRITKSSATASPTAKDLNKKIATLEAVQHDEPEQKVDEILAPPTAEAVDEVKEEVKHEPEQAEEEEIVVPKKAAVAKSTRELEAEKITDAAIKKYWKMEEESRIAPRVHQTTLSLPEKILRHFDLSSQYGPCVGISRMKRWKRADGLGLQPPLEVLAVLLREEEKGSEREKFQREKRRSGGSVASVSSSTTAKEEGVMDEWNRAYVDELLEGKAGVVE